MEKLLKESKAKYLKQSFLAITANSGGFRLCELGEDLNEDALEAKVKFLIPAGVRYRDNCFYKPLVTGKEEVISCGLILTDVKLSTLTRLLLQLPDSEIDRITSAINESYAVLQGVQPLTTTEDQLLVPKTYCNKDENNFVIENAESFAESFDNYTLNNINVGVEVESIIQNLDINNLLFSENFNLNKGDIVKVDSATQEVGLSTFESDSGSLYVPSNASIASSSITETKCKRKQSGCKFKIPKQRRLSKIIETPNNCVDSDQDAACNEFGKNYVTSQGEKQCPNVEIGQNKIKENNVPKQAAIYFSASKKKECNSKRVYDKKHVCLYCNKLVCKITRHLSSTHASECDVSKLLSLPMNNKERKNGFVELMRMGDFYHNSHVLAIEEGELILVRRPSEEESRLVSYSDFGPCPGCTGFMLKKHLWHHTRECFSFKKGNDANKNILQQSNALMAAVLHPNISEAFSKNVLSKMNDDDIGKIAKSDETIISFGMMMVEKHEDEQYELTRQSMRQLSRLLIELRKVTNYPDSNLKHYIKPICFDDIVLAVKSISGINNRSEKAIPSLALKLGYHLQKCAAILRGKALRLSNSEDDKSYRDFLDLYNLEWQTRISSSALNVMNQRNMNSVSMIPLTSDLMKINSALTEELKTRLNEANQSELDTESWLKLAKVTLCRLIMFNKKRGGEAARITIQQYASKPDWNAENAENFLESLSELERHLVDKLTLIEIRGKRRKVVPVLLTEDVNKAITVLINTREAAGVSKYNPYIFARPYCSSLEALRGSDCLRDFVKTLNLQKPKLVSSTKLRKYIATTSQVFNLHENEVDWLARHLGHDINVHRNFYRIHHSAIELTKVSKLLMAVDKGKINQFAGKTLDEINVEDLFDDGSEIDEHEKDDGSDVDDPDNDPNFTEDVLPERAAPSASESMMTADNIPASSSARKLSTGTRKGNKTPWNTDEKKIVLTFFRDNIKHKSLPGKTQCLKCINDNKNLLGHRSWTKIKDFVRNHLKSLNHTV